MEKDISLPKPVVGITLRNGHALTCYPQPLKMFNMSRKRSEVAEDEKLFVENAHLLLANAARIMSDSRMFLSDTRVFNGTAISGPFKPACLGAYLEWWIYDRNVSLDHEGNPIWLISGSGLSSGHNSKVITPSGKVKDLIMSEKVTFHDVFKSFLKASSPYCEAMQSCQSYTLKEVVDILKGEEDADASSESLQRLSIEQLENCIDRQNQLLREKETYCTELKGKIQLLLFHKYCKELTEYLSETARLKEKLYELYNERDEIQCEELGLRGNLCQDNEIMEEVKARHRAAKKKCREADKEYQRYMISGLKELIGDDAQWFTWFSAKRMTEENPTDEWHFDPGYDPDAWG